jgi:asparagine synthase (glutamine-hydrolysing)
VRGLAGALSRALPDVAPGKNWLHHVSLPARLRFVDGESVFPTNVKRRLLEPELAALPDLLEERARLLDGAPGDALSRLLYFETMTYLPLDILTKVDRMTMAHSLEARPPLLDHHLVEAVFALPSSLKLELGRPRPAQKRILRAAVEKLLPREILDRPKRGFGVPIRDWFRGPLADAIADVLLSKRARERGWMKPSFVRAIVDEHRSGRRDQSVRMWALLMLEQWCRKILDVPVSRGIEAPSIETESAHA